MHTDSHHLDVAALSFEDAYAELEAIVRRLEDGTDRLEEALRSYERGVVLLRHCLQLLNQAELRVQQLAAISPEGQPTLVPFSPGAVADVPPDASRLSSTPPAPDAGASDDPDAATGGKFHSKDD